MLDPVELPAMVFQRTKALAGRVGGMPTIVTKYHRSHVDNLH
jgi:hypothetical protein